MTAEQEQIYNYEWALAPYDTPEGRAAAPQWLKDKMGEKSPGPAAGSQRLANATQPASRTPAQRFLANWSPWGMGTLGLGIVLVIIAIVLHDHFALPNAVCSSSLGQLGQAFSGTAYADCSSAATAESAVGPLVLFGVGALLVGAGKMVIALIGAAMLANENAPADRPAPRSASPQSATPAASLAYSASPAPTVSSAPAASSSHSAAAVPRLFCVRCGKRGTPEDRFCGECGATMNTAPRRQPPVETH